MKLSSLADRRAEDDPHGPAVADARQALSNGQLLERVDTAAQLLHDNGIGVSDVVAVKLRNRVEFVVLLFAAWRLGAAVTPVNPSLTGEEVTRQLADSGARLLVTDDEDATATNDVLTLTVAQLASHPVGPVQPPHDDPSALALLIYTSGTTGTPKGVMLDHANLDAMADMGRQALQIGPADRCLLILPLFHVNGIVVSIVTPLLAGASVVIADRFDPRTFFDVVERERPTYFSAVPTIYTMLAALPVNVTPDTSSLRFAICGAAPASSELLSRFETRYGFPLIEGYGLSEGTCASTINPIEDPRAGTVGKPFPGQRIRIVDESGAEVPIGVDGEVLIAGPNLMRGYLGRPQDTARTIVDGWLHTGDIGHRDADGYLSLAGRSKDMIIRGGENIYPREIEDVLAADPTVLEAAVIGAPDEKWGEIVVAYVAPRPGAAIDSQALQALCVRKLAGYKRPTSIIVVDAIPKNPVGKTDKGPLRAAHSSEPT
ncbi:long-chain fatty acid--CoA ligase [Mycobacterium cookii]|uniref:Long-chain-fatty-acid--CoA ligase FadD13 n=1 Tax=Mycobacterium cookii TaxID=1775 RepID=A0A7I7L3S4_9MYCO|nr:AMP-binding protein [Mycobacterium cookii]MCV7329478.1 AMP-binding protein [Mycobacterium cookii]BBX48687.1 AMP-dependent ligase [Mycobacterium cookii]